MYLCRLTHIAVYSFLLSVGLLSITSYSMRLLPFNYTLIIASTSLHLGFTLDSFFCKFSFDFFGFLIIHQVSPQSPHHSDGSQAGGDRGLTAHTDKKVLNKEKRPHRPPLPPPQH